MIYIILPIILVIFVVHYAIHHTKNAKLINEIPGPKLLPIIGNGFDFLVNREEMFKNLRVMVKEYGNTIRVWIFNIPVVNIYNPEDIEVLFSSIKHIDKNFTYDFFHPWLNEGLLTSTGQKWQRRRKILTPSFHFSILRQFCQIFVKQGNELINKLNLEIGQKEFDVESIIRNFALHSICETTMGIKMDSINEKDKIKYTNAIHKMSQFFVHRMMRMWLYNPLMFSLSPVGIKQKKTVSILHKFTTNVIRKRRLYKNQTKNETIGETEDINVPGLKKPLAFMDLLLTAESEGKIDENGIREEVDTFMFEGHDTITIALTCGLMEIANNRHVQEKIVDEIINVFPDPNSPITIEKLNDLHYLECCIKETMRLYPSVTNLGRTNGEDMQLKNYLVPKGTTCFVSVFDVHRDPKFYPEPNKFDPDRFSIENCAKRHPFAYIPFSAGPRNCIGRKYAMLEQKVVILSILKKIKLIPVTRPQDIVFLSDVILRTKYPIKVKIIPNNIYE